MIKDKVCEICGAKKSLTRHHVIPKRFAKLAPLTEVQQYQECKILCRKCHDRIEQYYLYFDPIKSSKHQKYMRATKNLKKYIKFRYEMFFSVIINEYIEFGGVNYFDLLRFYPEFYRWCKGIVSKNEKTLVKIEKRLNYENLITLQL